MKIYLASQCALGACLMGSSFALGKEIEARNLQRENILTYDPMTQVTDAAAIDLDQIALESMLPLLGTPDAMAQALSVYTNGGFSGSYAKLTLDAPISSAIDFNLTEGTIVSGEAFENGDVRGALMEPLTGGHTEALVRYETTDDQRNYVGCQVGGSPNPIVDGCFAASGDLVVGDPEDVLTFNFGYSYNVLTDNQNTRTLQGFSTSAKENLYDCANCPYDVYNKFYNYYGRFDYGDEWILAAFNRGATSFTNGNADFSEFGDDDMDGIVEAIKKGTVFLNVYMEVIKSMENAVDRCEAGEDSRVQSWDEAVAFYVGSMAKVTNGNEGNFLYTNAKKRCRNFGTCEGANGEANANTAILDQFTLAQRHLFVGECEEVRIAKDRISDLMAVPLIQGTLRFAYLMDQEGIIDSRSDVTSATYAASILPLVRSCSPVDAQILYSNMKVGATGVNFADVKLALERNYRCMGLTCDDVGGLLSNEGDYVEGAEPCDDSTMIFNETPDQLNATLETLVPATSSPVSMAPETTQPTVGTQVPVNLTDAPTTIEEGVAANATAPPVEVLTPYPPKCPPCSDSSATDPVTASQRLSECPILVEQQRDAITKGCECACFVDSAFAFCAQQAVTYTGSGNLVGPCEIELQDSLIEDDESDVEDFVPATEAPVAVVSNATETSNGTTGGVDNATSTADSSTNAVGEDETDPNDFNIAAAETDSGGLPGPDRLIGVVASVLVASSLL